MLFALLILLLCNTCVILYDAFAVGMQLPTEAVVGSEQLMLPLVQPTATAAKGCAVRRPAVLCAAPLQPLRCFAFSSVHLRCALPSA